MRSNSRVWSHLELQAELPDDALPLMSSEMTVMQSKDKIHANGSRLTNWATLTLQNPQAEVKMGQSIKEWTMNQTRWIAITAMLLAVAGVSGAPAPEPAAVYTVTDEALLPPGEYYERKVPATLDLAERARVAVHGLTHMLNDKDLYSPFEHAFFNTDPPCMSRVFGPGRGCWSKLTEATLLARLMSGTDEHLDIQRQSLQNMLAWTQFDGITPMVRALSTCMTLHEQDPNPALRQLIEKMVSSLHETARHDGSMSWNYAQDGAFADSKLGVIGWGWNVFIQGNALRVLSRYADGRGADDALPLARGLKNFLLQEKFWKPDGAPKAVVPYERAQFAGHHHSYTAALMGLLRYAEATNDRQVAEFVRAGYEFLRGFGIARIGMFGEMCTTGDMTFLAIKLSEMGVGDYWDDADCYVRNQLAELQITDAEKMLRAVKAEPIFARVDPTRPDGIQQLKSDVQEERPLHEVDDTIDRVVERTVGSFLSDSGTPTCIPKHRFLATVCCTGNCVPALFFAWDSTVRFQRGHAQINLLLNRASPWLDLDSYLPHQGKVVIENKQAETLAVRIPGWVALDRVTARVNESAADFFMNGRYLHLAGLESGDRITIEFPMVETTETHTSVWGQHEFWMESTNPGHAWKPSPTAYSFRFRGNTLIEVLPRCEGNLYTLYERRALDTDEVTMTAVRRFVTPISIDW
jgi:hypothetical protein